MTVLFWLWLWCYAQIATWRAARRYARYAACVRRALASEDLVEINRDIALSERLTRINITRVLSFETRPIRTEVIFEHVNTTH